MNAYVMPEADTSDLHMGRHRCFGISHRGLQRTSNEDRHLIKGLKDNAVLIAVADGLGDESNGNNVAESVKQALAGIDAIPEHSEAATLEAYARKIDRAIYAEGLSRPGAEGMGSTLLAVLMRNGAAHWVHVGDSRLYLFRSGILHQVTEDQTLARFLVAEKEITPEQSLTHYSRHVMDQCVGCGFAKPETGTLSIRDYDLLILSTDGLHMQISPTRIASIVNAPVSIEAKADALIKAALNAGGTDNITVVLMEEQVDSGA